MAAETRGPQTSPSIWMRIAGFWWALHPFPSFLVSGLVVALILLANPDASRSLYLQLGMGMLCYQFAIGLVNDAVDAEDDMIAKPTKPIASGKLSRRTASFAAVVFVGAGLLITAGIPAVAWALGVAGLCCGLVYDLWLKRSMFSWLPMALALPMVPAFVWTATGNWNGYVAMVFPLGIPLGFSLHLANQQPDIAADSELGIRGIAQRIGPRSGSIAIAIFAATALITTTVVSTRSLPSAAGSLAVLGLTLVLLPHSTRLFGRDGLFGLLAATSAVLAILFLAAA